MIRQVTARNARANAPLLDAMYRARARLFADRLGWAVAVDAKGREIDRYDDLSPLYLIAVDEADRHRGSLRLLPTTGETMLREAATTAFDGVDIASATVWECTRFCVEGADAARITAELLLGMCETGLERGMARILGLFDERTLETYRHAGWPPETVGRSDGEGGAVYLGLWAVSEETAAEIRHRNGIAGRVMAASASP